MRYEAKDAPDSPGWWAFEGIYPHSLCIPVRWVNQLKIWEVHEETGTVRMQWGDDQEPHIVHMRYFENIIRGKFYRLHMPWEQQSPAEWQPVEYEDIFTSQGEPLRPDYKTICDKWYDFGARANDTEDGYEYAVCRKAKESSG